MIIIAKEIDAGQRLDIFVASQIDESRATIQKLLAVDKILLNGEPVKAKQKIDESDEISIEIDPPTNEDILPEKVEFGIAYEDDYLIVVNKPAGLVVHPAPGNPNGTLVNGLMYHSNTLSNVNGDFRPGIVHRIDKDTSGLLVVAKTNEAHEGLSLQFKDKSTKREYYALVHGKIEEDEAEIIAPIGRNHVNRQMMEVTSKNSKDAITHVFTLERYEKYTFIKCVLETGRTHQIRVHLKYISHPLVGDVKYGPKKSIDTKGQALHAKTLGFVHPITKEYMEFNSELPEEFLISLDKIRNEVE